MASSVKYRDEPDLASLIQAFAVFTVEVSELVGPKLIAMYLHEVTKSPIIVYDFAIRDRGSVKLEWFNLFAGSQLVDDR